LIQNGEPSQPWIHSGIVDSTFILLPSFLAVGFVLLFRDVFDQSTGVPLWAWVSLILCVDVAHVYSTIFRTYLNPDEFKERRQLFTVVPLVCWLVGVLLYSVHAMLFWSVLAYTAVFHFARQQYGFMMLYSRLESVHQRKYNWIDKAMVYSATGYPIIYWHTHLPRNFHWFVEGDFVLGLPPVLDWVGAAIYWAIGALYFSKEVYFWLRLKSVNLPKQFIIIGTAISWYLGIVALNGDMAFTMTNVLSHGLPYMSLIWIFGRKQAVKTPHQRILGRISFAHIFSLRMIPVFLAILVLLAFLEEGLWDGLVWRDRQGMFSVFSWLPRVEDHATLAWLVPLLSLPQSVHYVLDGFIWRLRGRKSSWQGVVFQNEDQLP